MYVGMYVCMETEQVGPLLWNGLAVQAVVKMRQSCSHQKEIMKNYYVSALDVYIMILSIIIISTINQIT